MVWITFDRKTNCLYVRAEVKRAKEMDELARRIGSWARWVQTFHAGRMPAETMMKPSRQVPA